MTTGEAGKVDLVRFTFQSLYFCATPVEQLSGDWFMTAVNQWYMPLVRSGWAVPLSFVLDVGVMLQRPSTAFRRRWKDQVRDEIKQLTLNYTQMLVGLRRQPIFAGVTDLLARLDEPAQRNIATRAFLRYLLAGLSHFRNTYSFNVRDLRLLQAHPTAAGVDGLRMTLGGKTVNTTMKFGDPARVSSRNEFGTIIDILQGITDYYCQNPLNAFISPEEQLMVTVTALSSAPPGRVDYRFLHEFLNRADLDGIEPVRPKPPPVKQIIPTDAYEIDGHVGGYIDVNSRKFTGNLAEVLPVELALFAEPIVAYQRLLNDGALHVVREDVECIERELRVLLCFVVDVHERMLAATPDVDAALGKGLTPYIRARVLVARLLMDLARHLPREDVHVDCAVFLWSRQARHTYRTEFSLFEAFSPAAAADCHALAGVLAERCPYLFYNRLPIQARQANAALDRDPGQYLLHRSQSRVYHARHLFLFTCEGSAPLAIPQHDPHLHAYEHGPDSIVVTYCDVERATLGFARPQSLAAATDPGLAGGVGQLNEERLRAKLVDMLLAKISGRPASENAWDNLSDVL